MSQSDLRKDSSNDGERKEIEKVEEDICPICHCGLYSADIALFGCPKKHLFHHKCIQPLIKENGVKCPMCLHEFKMSDGDNNPGNSAIKRQREEVSGEENDDLMLVRTIGRVIGNTPEETVVFSTTLGSRNLRGIIRNTRSRGNVRGRLAIVHF
jgi:hypothetical protein